MKRHSRAAAASATLIAVTLALAGCSGSTAGHVGGSTGGGSVGGVGGPPAPTVVTEVDVCHVNFDPAATGPNNALGMVWAGGTITFSVSVDCPKPLTRGQLQYSIPYTGTDAAQIDLAPGKSFPMAGVQHGKFPLVLPCKPGLYYFEYRWDGTISGASDSKQDANTGTGILLTSTNCK